MSPLSRFLALALICVCAQAQPYAFVTNTPTNGVSVIDTRTNSYVYTILGFSDAKGITATRDGARVYIAESGTSKVIGLDAATFQQAAAISIPTKPNAVAVSPEGSKLYVASDTGSI